MSQDPAAATPGARAGGGASGASVMQESASGGAPGSRLLVTSLVIAVFLGRLDMFLVAIALPTIARDFRAGTGAVAWVTVGFLLFSTGTMLFFGRLAGRAGPRRLFVTGYAVFAAGALLCAVSPTLGALVAARCLQGLGGALMVVMTFSAVDRLLPAARAGATMGTLALAGALGVAVGSPLGGVLATVSWRWVFVVLAATGLAAIVVAWRALPAGAPRVDGAQPAAGSADRGADEAGRRPRLDYAGGALSFAALGAFILFLDVGQSRGWVSWPSLALLAGAVVLGALFLRRETRAAEPLIAPAVFKDRRVLLVGGICVSALLLMGGNNLLMPFYLELGKGMATAKAGLLLMMYSVTIMALSPFTGRMADRRAPRAVSAAGMAAGVAACAWFALTARAPGYLPVIGFLLALAVTFSLFLPANTKELLQAPPEEERGAGPALVGTLNALALLLGAAVFKTVFLASVGLRDPALAHPGAATSAPAAADAAAGVASSAGATDAAAGLAGPAWWAAGFSPAYAAGAVACGVALALCLAGLRRRASHRPA